MLDDSPLQVPTPTGLYVPQNYDRLFRGPVSLRTALSSSINIPAVRTLLMVGLEPFRERLQDLGFDSLTEDAEFYGPSLSLGSADITLWELTNAYRTLARGGRWSPPRLRQDGLHQVGACGGGTAPPDAAGFGQRIEGLAARIDEITPRIDATAAAQERVLADIAVNELEVQKRRLADYATQAQFALAALQDDAAGGDTQ